MARQITPRGPRGPYRAAGYINLKPIEAVRIERRMTQAQAAKALGVTERTWRTWERGSKSAPAVETITMKLDLRRAELRLASLSGLTPADSNRKAPGP